jgi:ATP-dependent Zn protease
VKRLTAMQIPFLTSHSHELNALADVFMEHETLTESEIKNYLAEVKSSNS